MEGAMHNLNTSQVKQKKRINELPWTIVWKKKSSPNATWASYFIDPLLTSLDKKIMILLSQKNDFAGILSFQSD